MTPARPTVDVDGLAELLAAATPGPWIHAYQSLCVDTGKCAGGACDTGYGHEPGCSLDQIGQVSDADAALIVAAVNALPDLLAHLAAVTAERDEARAAVADAWDIGYMAAYLFERGEVYPEPDNPYRAAALGHVPTTEGGEG